MPAGSSQQTTRAGHRKRAGLRQQRDHQHPQRVNEMVEHGLLVNAQRVGVQPGFQPVRAERAQNHRQRQKNRADRAPVH